jgi:hypothetical protein
VAAAGSAAFPFFLSSCAVAASFCHRLLSAIGFFLLSASFCYRLLSAIGFFLVPSLVIQIGLNKFFSLHGSASMTWACEVLNTLNYFLKNYVP